MHRRPLKGGGVRERPPPQMLLSWVKSLGRIWKVGFERGGHVLRADGSRGSGLPRVNKGMGQPVSSGFWVQVYTEYSQRIRGHVWAREWGSREWGRWEGGKVLRAKSSGQPEGREGRPRGVEVGRGVSPKENGPGGGSRSRSSENAARRTV